MNDQEVQDLPDASTAAELVGAIVSVPPRGFWAVGAVHGTGVVDACPRRMARGVARRGGRRLAGHLGSHLRVREHCRARSHPGRAAALYAATRITLGPVVIGRSTLLVVAAGIALVALAPWVGFSDDWIVIGFVAYALVTLVGLGMGSIAKKAGPGAPDANDDPRLSTLTRTWLRYAIVVTAVPVIAPVGMVVKP
jgi:hypothetical protein